jgi:ribosomal protein S18 acetylase RimI-like enzyme
MSKSTATLPPPNLTLRRIFMRDLPSIIEIEQQPTMRWPLRDLRAVLQSSNAAGWVAEINGRVVAFLIYVVGLQPAQNSDDPATGCTNRIDSASRPHTGQPLHITLLNMAVAPVWQRTGLGRALLAKLNQALQHPRDRIQTTVPESNLAAQLTLRAAGYKAIRVLRGFFDTEDGYLLERRRD